LSQVVGLLVFTILLRNTCYVYLYACAAVSRDTSEALERAAEIKERRPERANKPFQPTKEAKRPPVPAGFCAARCTNAHNHDMMK
jgi:hypothetical protein